MRPSIVFIYLLIGLTGCLTTRADLRADSQESANRPDPAPREVAQAEEAERPPPPRPVPPPSAANRLEDTDEQLRTLTGRIEVLENTAAQATAMVSVEKTAQMQEKQKLDARFAAFEEALKKLDAQIQAVAEDVAHLKLPPPAPVVPIGAKGRGDFDEGENLFGAKKYKESIVAYQRYRDANPKGQKYPEATLKIGMAFQELGLKDESKAFYEEVTSKFPKAPEAKKAHQRLKSIK